MSIKQRIFRNLSNLPGWRTKRKIIVFESDDWGSIRTPSKEVIDNLEDEGVLLSRDHFTALDCLEENDDLEKLYDLLAGFRDSRGRSPVFTAMFIPCNPDFRKIEQRNFDSYHYENTRNTLLDYPNRDRVHQLWHLGIRERLFVPQFHGREHLQVQSWMRALQAQNRVTKLAFQNRMTGIAPRLTNEKRIDYQAAFHLETPEELKYMHEVLEVGLKEFERIFDYAATYFVPPNGPFNRKLESTLAKCGIRFIGTPKVFLDYLGDGRKKTYWRWLGKRNNLGQTYLTRNGRFEPSRRDVHKDWIDACLADIQSAFNFRKPAVISSHRVNYVGGIVPENRIQGLTALKKLLKNIISKWPEVEFLTSTELGEIISGPSTDSIGQGGGSY